MRLTDYLMLLLIKHFVARNACLDETLHLLQINELNHNTYDYVIGTLNGAFFYVH